MIEEVHTPNTYLFPSESAAEMGRLLLQDRLFTTAMGGLFPESPDLTDVVRVLDIGCGPGGWAMHVAQAYPRMMVTGIDISELMIAFALAQKEREQIQNVQFVVADARDRLPFETGSFQCITIRLATAWVHQWSALFAECARLLTPGGLVRVIETDHAGVSTSLAFEEFHRLLAALYQRRGLGFSHSGLHFGITPRLRSLLTHAGFAAINKQAFVVEASPAIERYRDHCQNIITVFEQLRPQWQEEQLATPEQMDRLRFEIESDLLEPTFSVLLYGVVFWGEKPQEPPVKRYEEALLTSPIPEPAKTGFQRGCGSPDRCPHQPSAGEPNLARGC
jgi:ubiquinone/menaquinone biosynthesis C-methylase UbiE